MPDEFWGFIMIHDPGFYLKELEFLKSISYSQKLEENNKWK